MRVKEGSSDYRYFPEPDIPFVIITEDRINRVVQSIPMLADERREKYISLGVSDINTNKLDESLETNINEDKIIDILNQMLVNLKQVKSLTL